MNLKILLFIAMGGALGAVMRFAVGSGVHQLLGRGFPYGTLVVNVAGSLLIGILYIVMLERMALEPHWRALVITGFIGALTTFSTFSLETFQLIENGAMFKATANVAANVILCLLTCWAGILIGRQL
ncbi:MAG: fluoride efflux transporter CrcB [Gammaproteobacteria bacterium]